MNPTQAFTKRPIPMPEPIPDSESERMERIQQILAEVRELGPQSEKEWTTWEREIIADIEKGMACTRVRFSELREAANRIRKKLRA